MLSMAPVSEKYERRSQVYSHFDSTIRTKVRIQKLIGELRPAERVKLMYLSVYIYDSEKVKQALLRLK